MLKENLSRVIGTMILFAIQFKVMATSVPPQLEMITTGHGLPGGSYAFVVHEKGQDRPLLSINADKPMNPASAIKVVTTLAALEELGPAYHWRTDVYAMGKVVAGVLHGDLLIKGYGDPYLVTENFWKLLQELRRKGIRHVTGDLVIDDSFFEVPNIDTAEFDNKPERTYNVLPNALLVNFKAAYFHFYPAPNGKSVIVRPDPELPNLQIDNRLRLKKGRCGGYQRGIAITIPRSEAVDKVLLDGKFPASCGHYVMARTVLQPDTFAYGVFKSLWQQLGGKLNGKVRKGLAPEDKEPFVSWRSRPLGELIRLVNKFSNNVMTRQMLLTLAAEFDGTTGREESGRQLIREYLEQKGMDTTSLNLVNGAGLSRETRISARLLADILLYAEDIPFMPEFVSSLSIMGIDGTARNRLKKTMRSGHAHIKTGTIDDVSAITGYVNARSGKKYIVAGMLNHKNAHRGPGEELMNALISWAYRQ